MAITCVHGTITKDAMKAAGFTDAAAEIAAKANEFVDEKQGNSADEANLHAMRGMALENPVLSMSPALALQPESAARAAFVRILTQGSKDIQDAVLAGPYQYREAFERLGETLHTVQDRAFHNFEPWPYTGLADALKNNPNYMICHAIRDLSVVSDIVIGPMGQQKEIELSRRIARDVYVGVRLFDNARATNPYLPPTSYGPQWNSGFSGAGALFSVTIGAAPGSLPRPGSPVQTEQSVGGDAFWLTTDRGVAMRTRAEDDTAEFLRSIKKAVTSNPGGDARWAAFLAWNGMANGSAPLDSRK